MIKSIKETFELKLKKYSFLSIFLILIFSNFSIADENSKNFVGFIDTLDGKATKGSDENLVELNEFDQIFINDKIKTDKDSLITISFNDNSLLTLKGESEFYVQEFDKNSSTQKFILSIPNGKFSFESGTIAKSKKGVMKIKLSGLDVKLTGTLTVGQNFEGNKSVTLIEDSMGNLGKLEVGLEGSNETKIIEESASGISMDFTEEEQQALDAGNIDTITTNVSELEETTMSEEEKNQIVEEIKEVTVQSATKSEEKIDRAITKQLAAGTIPDANGDGVADLADVEAYKAELLNLKESKLEYVVEQSQEDLSLLSEIIVNSESDQSMNLMENLIETNADNAALLMTEIVEQEFDIFSHVANAELGNFEALRETIVTEMIEDDSDFAADTMAQMMAVSGAEMSSYIVNEITNFEPEENEDNFAMEVLATFTEVASDKMTEFLQADPEMMNALTSHAFENANEEHIEMISDMMQETPGQNSAYLMASMVENNAEMIADVYENLAEQDFDIFNHIETAKDEMEMYTDPFMPMPGEEDAFLPDPFITEDPLMTGDTFMPMPEDAPFMPIPDDEFMTDPTMMAAQENYLDDLKGEIFSEIINHSEGTAADITADLMMNSQGDSAMFMMETMMEMNPEIIGDVMQNFIEEDFDIFEHFEEVAVEAEPEIEVTDVAIDDEAPKAKKGKGLTKEERVAAKAARKAEKQRIREEKKAARQARKAEKKLERERRKEEKRLARLLKKQQREMGIDTDLEFEDPQFDIDTPTVDPTFSAVQNLKTDIIGEMIQHGNENTMDTMAQMIATSDDVETSAMIFETVMEQSELLENNPTENFGDQDNLSLELLSSLNDVQPEIMNEIFEDQSSLMEEVIEDAFSEVSLENASLVADIIVDVDNSDLASEMFEIVNEDADQGVMQEVFTEVAVENPDTIVAMAEMDDGLYQDIVSDPGTGMSVTDLMQDIMQEENYDPTIDDPTMNDAFMMGGDPYYDDPYMTAMYDPYMADPYMNDPYMTAMNDPYYDPYMMGAYDPYYDPYMMDPYYDPYKNDNDYTYYDPYKDDEDDNDDKDDKDDDDYSDYYQYPYLTYADWYAAHGGGGSGYGTVSWDMQPDDQTFNKDDSVSISSHYAMMTGGSTLFYTATGLGGSGLSIDSSTGYITGNPTSADTYTVTITAQDSSTDCIDAAYTYCKVDSDSFDIVITDDSSGYGTVTWDMQPTDQTFNKSDSVSITSHSASMTGGGILQYTATGLGGSGLSINISTGYIEGNPTSADTYTVTITAQDDSADCMDASAYAYCKIDSNSFDIVITDDSSGYGTVTWDMQPGDETFTTSDNVSISSHSAMMTGGSTLFYTATGLGSSGLSINSSTGYITGSSGMTTAGIYTVSIIAQDSSTDCTAAFYTSCQATSNTFDIEITGSGGSYGTVTWDMQPTDETFGDSDNINISSHSASMTGGGSIEYSATGLSGSGLSINTSTGAIIGTGPTSVVGIYSGIIITAKDNSADCMTAAAYAYCRIDSNSFEIEIAASGGGDPTWTSNVPMMQTNLTYTTDTSISSINLSAQTDPGGNSVSYNASGLPPGLTLAGNLISGVPETSGVYSVTLKATDQSNNNFIQTIVTFNIDPSNSMDVYWVDQTPASGTIGEYTANTNVDLTFSAEIEYDDTDIRYRLISNMGIIPGRTTALPENELPSWLTWESNTMYDNPTTDTGVAEITGMTPSQDIDYNYAFTVRAFVETKEAMDFNDRDFVIKVLEDASCVSPVNNICT